AVPGRVCAAIGHWRQKQAVAKAKRARGKRARGIRRVVVICRAEIDVWLMLRQLRARSYWVDFLFRSLGAFSYSTSNHDLRLTTTYAVAAFSRRFAAGAAGPLFRLVMCGAATASTLSQSPRPLLSNPV